MNSYINRTSKKTFWWPVMALSSGGVPPQDSAKSKAEMLGPERKLVLIIDDDASIRAMVADLLEFEGYNVATAANGLEGLALVRQLRPSLVLLDMRMPTLDGWGFAEALEEQNNRPPIVVMTAARNARLWAEEIDAAGYVSKPFDVHELLDRIERLLSSA
jgi:two-component system response regulator MprA